MTVQEILTAAGQLSAEERLQVAIRLLESLQTPDPGFVPPPNTDRDPILAWEGEVLVYQGRIAPTVDLVAAVQAAREERSFGL